MIAKKVGVLKYFDDLIRNGDEIYEAEAREARAAVAKLIEAAERANKLINLLTVRQVIEAGDEAIEASGLNQWCLNEGLAEGRESIGFWLLGAALARVQGGAA